MFQLSVSEQNALANEFDFKKALDLLRFIDKVHFILAMVIWMRLHKFFMYILF